MISGFVLRNGANGTANLASVGRTNLPAWAGRAYNRSTALSVSEYGPNVSTTYPLGRYLEDNDYLADLGKTQGVDFDLDEYNGRFCVTPDYPSGIYAYFVSISSNGTPVFPYNIGRAFYGAPTGNTVSSLSEQVTTNFIGGASSQSVLNMPAVTPETVTISWSSIEGGTYRVEASNDLTIWNDKATNVSAQGITTQVTTNQNGAVEFFRVSRTDLSSYDPAK
jgi:hypothetical protein